MELIEGVTLDDVLAEVPRLPLLRAARILRDVLAGLGHAHAHGLVHRDLTPRNIMLVGTGERETAKVLDFGLARDFSADDRVTRDGIICGTPSYMSPEQALGRSLDRRSDLYAASIVFFEMLTGKTPFAHDEAVKVLAGHVSGSVPAMREVAEIDVPGTVEALIHRGLAKKPDQRPPSAEAYLEELERALSVVSASTVIELSSRDMRTIAPSSSSSSAQLPPRRPWTPRQRLAAGAAALGVLLIGIVAAVASGGDDAPAPAPVAKTAAAEPDLEMAPEDRDDALGAAIHLAASGRREDAVGKLRTLRKSHPRDARIPAALGHVYAELGWPKQTLDAYRDALRLDPELRDQPVLIEDIAALLESKSSWTQANRVIERDLGEAAVPHLRDMSEHHPDSIVRGRAARLVAKLSGE
jgi:hypothetical protein